MTLTYLGETTYLAIHTTYSTYLSYRIDFGVIFLLWFDRISKNVFHLIKMMSIVQGFFAFISIPIFGLRINNF